jgi:hypothetical protein
MINAVLFRPSFDGLVEFIVEELSSVLGFRSFGNDLDRQTSKHRRSFHCFLSPTRVADTFYHFLQQLMLIVHHFQIVESK